MEDGRAAIQRLHWRQTSDAQWSSGTEYCQAKQRPTAYRRDRALPSGHLLQHLQNLAFELLDVALDVGEGAGGLVDVEVAVGRKFLAAPGFLEIDPRIPPLRVSLLFQIWEANVRAQGDHITL